MTSRRAPGWRPPRLPTTPPARRGRAPPPRANRASPFLLRARRKKNVYAARARRRPRRRSRRRRRPCSYTLRSPCDASSSALVSPRRTPGTGACRLRGACVRRGPGRRAPPPGALRAPRQPPRARTACAPPRRADQRRRLRSISVSSPGFGRSPPRPNAVGHWTRRAGRPRMRPRARSRARRARRARARFPRRTRPPATTVSRGTPRRGPTPRVPSLLCPLARRAWGDSRRSAPPSPRRCAPPSQKASRQRRASPPRTGCPTRRESDGLVLWSPPRRPSGLRRCPVRASGVG